MKALLCNYTGFTPRGPSIFPRYSSRVIFLFVFLWWREQLQLFQQVVAAWEQSFTLTVRRGWLPPAGGHHNSLAKSTPLCFQNKRRLDRRSPVLLRASHSLFLSAARHGQFFYHGASPLSSPDGRDITWEGQTPIRLDDNLIYVCITVIQGTCPSVAQTKLNDAASLFSITLEKFGLIFWQQKKWVWTFSRIIS